MEKAAAAIALMLLVSGSGSASERPNVVVVLVDDLGYADFSCIGGSVKTPNVDRLAAEGIRFTQYYANSPICSPSRAALTTGQYPIRWGITSYLDNRELNRRRGMAQFLDPKAPSLARFLKAGGYRTGHFGKWHLGGGRDVGEAPLPSEYGFDASLTQFEGLGDRVLPLIDDHDGKPPRRFPLGVASERLGRGNVSWVDRCQVTKAYVDRALEFIRESESAKLPFYINLWPDDVHSPFHPPAGMAGDGSKRARFEGVLANMDAQLGPLFDYLRTSPRLRDNTLVLVTSDNGPEPGAGSAGVFRGAKAALYEGGIRAPLIAWSPGLIPASRAGSKDETTVLSSIDLVPSILKLAGLNPKSAAFDGQDMSGALRGKPAKGRATALFWKRPPDRRGPPGERFPDLAIRDGNWKLLLMEDGSGQQLYDLAADPGEQWNLAESEPRVAERLSKRLTEWNRQWRILQGENLDRVPMPEDARRGDVPYAR